MSYYYPIQIQSNGFGTAGFIVSLISFFVCGLTSPIGLLMSLVALIWPPRGMAMAGVVLGFIGSLWLFFFGFAILVGIVGAFGVANMPVVEPPVN